MARNRMIKTEFWSDEKLATVSRDARLTFIALWNLSDDYGVVRGHHLWLKNTIYPYDEIKPADYKKWMGELENIRVILPFDGEGEKYYFIRGFMKHQVISRPSKLRNPSPPDGLNECSMNNHGVLNDESKRESKRERERERERESSPPPKKLKFVDFVFLTAEENEKLVDKFGVDETAGMINRLNLYLGQTGKTYKSHYFTLLKWAERDQALGSFSKEPRASPWVDDPLGVKAFAKKHGIEKEVFGEGAIK